LTGRAVSRFGLTPRDVERIAAATALDRELYGAAAELFARQWERLPSSRMQSEGG
jgi:hypothetical protein